MVVGGGCCLLRLTSKVEDIKNHLDNEEQKVCLFSIESYTYIGILLCGHLDEPRTWFQIYICSNKYFLSCSFLL